MHIAPLRQCEGARMLLLNTSKEVGNIALKGKSAKRRYRRENKISVLPVLLVLLLMFIWGNSMLPAKQSNRMSDIIVHIMGGESSSDAGVSEKVEGTRSTSACVRKLAHVSEYAALGFIFVFWRVRAGNTLVGQRSQIVLFAVSVPLIDETIQIFSNRTSSVKDIWIDLAGFALGSALVLTLSFWRRGRKYKESGNH